MPVHHNWTKRTAKPWASRRKGDGLPWRAAQLTDLGRAELQYDDYLVRGVKVTAPTATEAYEKYTEKTFTSPVTREAFCTGFHAGMAAAKGGAR